MMIVRRYENEATKEVTYTLQPKEVRVRVDKVFIDSMTQAELERVEGELVRKLFYQLFSQMQQMHKDGVLPQISRRGRIVE